MSYTEPNSDEKFILLKEIIAKIREANPYLKDRDTIKKGVEELRMKLKLKNKSASAFASEMAKIVAEKKGNGKSVFPPKKPSN